MKKTEEIYKQIEDKLNWDERNVLCYVFELGEDEPETEEEFKRQHYLDTEGIRENIRSALKKCKKEIKEMQEASRIFIDPNIWVKMGDIVEVTLQLGEPELDKETEELKREYEFIYYHKGKGFSDSSFEGEDGYCDNDICEYIKYNLENDTGISEYEIINYDSFSESQFAYIRVKSIGNSWHKYGK